MEKNATQGKSPFNFAPKQINIKKPASKGKSYTFLETDEPKIRSKPLSPSLNKTVAGFNPFKTNIGSLEESLPNIDFLTKKEYKEQSSCNICSKDFPSLISQIHKNHW